MNLVNRRDAARLLHNSFPKIPLDTWHGRLIRSEKNAAKFDFTLYRLPGTTHLHYEATDVIKKAQDFYIANPDGGKTEPNGRVRKPEIIDFRSSVSQN